MKRAVLRRPSAFTLVEVLVACTIAVIALAAVVAGATAMQRCFVAAEDFALAKSDQARLSDYIALDLRRALSVTAGTANDATDPTVLDHIETALKAYAASKGIPGAQVDCEGVSPAQASCEISNPANGRSVTATVAVNQTTGKLTITKVT